MSQNAPGLDAGFHAPLVQAHRQKLGPAQVEIEVGMSGAPDTMSARNQFGARLALLHRPGGSIERRE